MSLKLLATLLFLLHLASGFNISPSPNIAFQEPQLTTYMDKVRSSYFGYSINLRKKSILVGAPRAQSTLVNQRLVNETGAVYKCSLETEKCYPYIFDLNGNTHVENQDLAYNSEKKDYQMLGAAMDGLGSESDRFVVCAPKLIGNLETSDHYLLHGICYWVADTESEQPKGVRTITPLRQRSLQIFKVNDTLNHYYYMYGEQGFGVHVSDNNEEILMGAPGVYNWKGTVIRYKANERPDLGGLSRRDETAVTHSILKRQTMEYSSEVPNPHYSGLNDDSYFGYAVSSGYLMGNEDPRIFYVASAPQANGQTGQVYLFTITNIGFETQIKTLYEFKGTSMGEYFGYTLLVEDFNGDNLPDVAIAAPFYSKTGDYENGAVYIFLNLGNLYFELQAIITSDFAKSGRFGISLSKIGDINGDGYNDIAIGAPFEDNGVVYVHLGGAKGVTTTASQKLLAPETAPNGMFGHALSRGVDIDGNGYKDLAVGSPNTEMVYVFKSYPVIKVLATITPNKKEISLNDAGFQVNVCVKFESRYPIDYDIKLNIQMSVDMQLNRASFSKTDAQKILNNILDINNVNHCFEFDVYVKSTLSDIFKPIVVEMKYDLIDKIPEANGSFCEKCVAIDPNDPKTVTNKIAFSTGCAGDRCMSDLIVRGEPLNFKPPYVLGSSRTIAIKYEISNVGETAYLTQLKITIPTNVTQFSRTPPNCKIDLVGEMLCDIGLGKPLAMNEKTSIDIHFDTSRLDGTSFVINALVTSAGDESNPSDNVYENDIVLTEFSDIEVIGQSSKPQLSIEDGIRVENVTFQYEISNNGPSTVRELIVGIMIPISYFPRANYEVNIIDFHEMSIKAFYANKAVDITWYKENNILIQNAVEISTLPVIAENMNDMGYDSSKLGFDYDFSSGKGHDSSFNNEDYNHHRRRRSLESDVESVKKYNQYTNSVDDYEASYKLLPNQDDHTLNNLPPNRTIYFDCTDHETNVCIEAQFTVHNFRPGNTPITIRLDFQLDLKKIDDIFDEKKNIFLYQTYTKLQRGGEEGLSSFGETIRNPHTIVFEYLTAESPIWIIIISTIVGILVLILLCYALYRLGFFKRNKKEELERLTRQSMQGEELRNLN